MHCQSYPRARTVEWTIHIRASAQVVEELAVTDFDQSHIKMNRGRQPLEILSIQDIIMH